MSEALTGERCPCCGMAVGTVFHRTVEGCSTCRGVELRSSAAEAAERRRPDPGR